MREYASIPRGTVHLTSEGIDAMVSARAGFSEITDGCAAGIAAGWQAPRGYGAVFASLVSHFRVRVSELHDAIASSRAELPVGNTTYDGRFFVCPAGDGSEGWQDGYRDAMLHHGNGHGNIADGTEPADYFDGYMTAFLDVATYASRRELDALGTWAMNGPTDSREAEFTRRVMGGE